jgi:phosphoribosylamine--glycine ligase
MKVLLVGNGAREHAIAEALLRSPQNPELIVFADKTNPGIAKLAKVYELTDSLSNFAKLKELARREKPDFAIVGPDNPIGDGAADELESVGVATVAPVKELAQLESSKSFTRNLMQEYDIDGNPGFAVFYKWNAELSREQIAKLIENYMESLGGEFVVKADGLQGGKGVKVTGDHLAGVKDGLHYALKCLEEDGRVVVEEKLIGQEFSFMFLTDGYSLAPLPIVQDHKRAFEGDKGPNTGGMGSYSGADNSLPFLTPEDVAAATKMTEEVLDALRQKYPDQLFRGVMYGGFIATRDGVRLIEYNARFGDPEAMNVLPILKTDFVEVCEALLAGRLVGTPLEFERKATVVKYAVPEGYPTDPKKGEELKIFGLPEGCRVYYAAVDQAADGRLLTSSSRALAFVGIADSLNQAEQLAEAGVKATEGPLAHRRDIGTEMLIDQRVRHMQSLRQNVDV